MQHLGQRLPNGNGRRGRPWAALGALLASLLVGLAPLPGCLNPRPEEDPSAFGAPDQSDTAADSPSPAAPERESCDDNPLLAGCAPQAPSGGSGQSPNESEPAPSVESPSGPADAGVAPGDAGAADAAAPNAEGGSVAD